MRHVIIPIIIALLISTICCKTNVAPAHVKVSDALVFSAIKGQNSKAQNIVFKTNIRLSNAELKITGQHSSFFIAKKVEPNTLSIYFKPSTNFVGIANAQLIVQHNLKTKATYTLKALSTKALEGKNEPPLFDVIKTLNFDINIGWSTLANTIKPKLQGDEIPQTLFTRANLGSVFMIPVARYSPAFLLPFGYYTVTGNGLPTKYKVGILADSNKYPEHQTLFPALQNGKTSFNPNKNEAFGFYTASPTHDAFSEDIWNKRLFKKHAIRACRIYQVKTANGTLVKNQYLVCFEEAKNGDYQDYVFLVKNIMPLK